MRHSPHDTPHKSEDHQENTHRPERDPAHQRGAGKRIRRNPLDVHGVIRLTALSLSGRERSRSIRSASASRPPAVNGHRPSATTTNGSAGTTSVHPAGSENNRPFSS